jgi:hypothetical protein
MLGAHDRLVLSPKEHVVMVSPPPQEYDRSQQLTYWLRRAEQEAIAAIRSASPQASASHERMAEAYSAMASSLLND